MEDSTLAQFAGQHARNYSTLPTIDVPIIPVGERVFHCATCGGEIANTADRTTNPYSAAKWEHIDRIAVEGHDFITPRVTCAYCGADTHTTFHQRNWSDETECTRCGGVDGFAIGD